MQYLGGKSRIADAIADTIKKHSTNTLYVEPFLGAASVAERLVPPFENALLSDAHPDLMMMWRAVLDGWVPPTTLSEDEYRELKTAEPSALRGFAGFPCSFGGKWFGGYARDPRYGRNYADVASRSIQQKVKRLQGATTVHANYQDLTFDKANAVVYADPPYASVTPYKGVPPFDSEGFWIVMESWADAGAEVFVSEYTAPERWVAVWEQEVKSSLAGKGSDREVRERLFTIGGNV